MSELAGTYLNRVIKKTAQRISRFAFSIPYNIRRAYNKKRIKSRGFTVISNNCWAGKLYQYLDMPYLSPTIGLYFFADDYIKFVKNLRYYISLDLRFISSKDSKYYSVLNSKNQLDIPIGLLDDVEIIFLHYKTEKEAYEKWSRRKERINWDNMYIKFSKMNLCTDNHLKEFDSLSYEKKFLFTTFKKKKYNCEVFWKENNNSNKNGEVFHDTVPFPGNIKLSFLIR